MAYISSEMVNKLSIAVLCGGQSTEHAISLRSAHNVVSALRSGSNQAKYEVYVIYLSEQGQWYYIPNITRFLQESGGHCLTLEAALEILQALKVSIDFGNPSKLKPLPVAIDCFFPVLHGTNGEDGSIQGLLQLFGVPYVGAGVLGSAICMDKDITKQLLTSQGILVTPWKSVTADIPLSRCEVLYQDLTTTWGQSIVVVKPATLGSSVGLSLVHNGQELSSALERAFRYDTRVMIEKYIQGREIECAVLGNHHPQVSLPGEILLHTALYTYEAKYLDSNGASTTIPAALPPTLTQSIRDIAERVFNILRCQGMLRVDFFVTSDHTVYVNEANTIPGFTDISLYPKMMQASGVDYSTLIDRLITLAIEQDQRSRSLERIYRP